MVRWQTWLAIVALLCAAAALLPLGGRFRITFAAGAIALILILLPMRLRAHAARRESARSSDIYARIARIREARNDRRR